MALQAAGSPLVAGSFLETHPETNMQLQTQKVRVTRMFYFDRKPQRVGDVVELPKIFANEVRAANKAEFVEDKSDDASGARASVPRGTKLV